MSKNLSSNDEWGALAQKAQGGDKQAYNQLLTALIPYIRNVLTPRLANIDWAEEITQEVLISVHKSLNTYSPEKPFKPWIMAIINFRRTDFLRKHYNKRDNAKTTLDDVDFQKSHVTNPQHAGEYKDVEKALEELPEKQRKVFEMIKIKGFTAQEVANETGMSVSAVKVSAHRTLKRLKQVLGG